MVFRLDPSVPVCPVALKQAGADQADVRGVFVEDVRHLLQEGSAGLLGDGQHLLGVQGIPLRAGPAGVVEAAVLKVVEYDVVEGVGVGEAGALALVLHVEVARL